MLCKGGSPPYFAIGVVEVLTTVTKIILKKSFHALRLYLNKRNIKLEILLKM